MKSWIFGTLLYLGSVAFSEACGGTFTSVSGTFTSPNYPNNYPNNQKCTYKFRTGYLVNFTCQVFMLQRCKTDFMKIVDGKKIKTFCGTSGPTGYTTTTTKANIIFQSNKKVQRQGFSCTYTSITDKTTTSISKTSKTTKTKTTITTTTTTASPMAPLLQSALALYNSGTCYSTERNACGCSGSVQSEYHTSIRGSYRIVAANGIPSHIYEEGQAVPNPNTACPNEVYMAVPTNPTKGSTYKGYGMGPVGIAISGGFFYNHLSSPMGDVAVVNEGESFDTCNGHSDPNCRYHYHLLPTCIAGEGDCNFVGYMRDGFSVYTYCTHETESRYLKSCYYLQSGDGSMANHYMYNDTAYNNGDCDLDRANGYTFSDSRGYGYIFTEDYPFIMAGYYGTVLSDICYLTSA